MGSTPSSSKAVPERIKESEETTSCGGGCCCDNKAKEIKKVDKSELTKRKYCCDGCT